MQSQAVNGQLYQRLGQNEIRLAHVLPAGDDSSLVNVRLETVSLDPKPDYDALSYCWGDPQVTRPICVNGEIVNITVNLEAALRQLRSEAQDAGIRLWADAISINQNDHSERSQQVSIMFQIYEKASTVRIWLGELEARAADGFRLLEKLLYGKAIQSGRWGRLPSELDYWDSEQQRSDGIEALACLCRAPYWKRVWIVQEVSHKAAFEERNVVHLGRLSFGLPHWTEVHSVHAWLQKGQAQRRSTSTTDVGCLGRLRALDPAIQDIRSAFYPLVIATWGFMTREILESGDVTFARFVPTFLAELRQLLATDPRDKIFGILGLLPGAMTLVPNYGLSMRSVYSEATAQIMEITKSVFILHQACSGNDGLPSWVPDYRYPLRIPSSFQHFQVFNADAVSSLIFEHTDDSILRLNGVVIDSICQVFHPGVAPAGGRVACIYALRAWRAFFRRYCLLKLPENVRMRVERYEPFWRTTCLGLTVVTPIANKTFDVSDTATLEDLYETLTHDSGASEEDHNWLDRVCHVVSEHDFFLTAKGHLGAVTQGVVGEGDRILIFPKAHCPFAARELLSNGQRAFALLSPCYIDGK